MELVTDISGPEWRDFLERTPGSSIFQSPAMARVFRHTKGYRPRVVAAHRGSAMRALMASTTVSYGKGRLSPLSSRSIVVGGPIGDINAFSELLTAHDAISAKSVLLTQIRNLDAPLDLRPFDSVAYRWEDHLNYVIDLRAGERAVLDGMSKARRKSITKAEESGLEIEQVQPNRLDLAYVLVNETYSRARVPLADVSLFRSAIEFLRPGGNLWTFAAKYEGSACAVRFVLLWGTTIYDWYAGSSEAGRALHADEWLVWQILRKGMQRGYGTFDFHGAGRPGKEYGPGEFKRRFGGRQTNPGRFEKVYRPLTLKLVKATYNVGRKLRWAPG